MTSEHVGRILATLRADNFTTFYAAFRSRQPDFYLYIYIHTIALHYITMKKYILNSFLFILSALLLSCDKKIDNKVIVLEDVSSKGILIKKNHYLFSRELTIKTATNIKVEKVCEEIYNYVEVGDSIK